MLLVMSSLAADLLLIAGVFGLGMWLTAWCVLSDDFAGSSSP